jgi:hypothetical protein
VAKPKPIACPCNDFTSALAAGFIETINAEFFLASLAGVGNLRSLIYGPQIMNCPFCGTRLDDKTGLPPE